MNFSKEEVRFLAGPHRQCESRSASAAGWPPLPDDMPPWMLQRALAYRAKILGVFAEFRNHSRNFSRESNDDLVQQVEAAKLF